MKLKPYAPISSIGDDTLVGFFYSLSNEEPPPFEERDHLYSLYGGDLYTVTTWTDPIPADDDEYINIEKGNRMYAFADVVGMYKQMKSEESFNKDEEKLFVYLSPTQVVDMEFFLGND